LHVSIDPAREKRVRERWMLYSRGVPLVVLDSPYRSLVDPIIEYVDRLQQQDPRNLITLVIPEFVPTGWWPKFLHGQAGLMLALRLRSKPGVVVINMPYHIEAYVPLTVDQEESGHDARGMSAHDIASIRPAAANGSTEALNNGHVAKDKVQ